jgi:anti-sigma factor RsiW
MTTADIISMIRDPQRAIQELLPWYVTGTLVPEEAAMVEAHLATCEACRAELETDRALGAMAASASLDVERGWAALKTRVEGDASRRRISLRRRVAALSHRRPTSAKPSARRSGGWAVAANAASLMLIAGFAWIWAHPQHAQYHVLSAPQVASPGNVVVIFKPTTSEQDMREMLRGAKARLVDGPTASDAYVLHVADVERAASLTKLRANGRVILAEPIDGDRGR